MTVRGKFLTAILMQMIPPPRVVRPKKRFRNEKAYREFIQETDDEHMFHLMEMSARDTRAQLDKEQEADEDQIRGDR